MKNALIEEIKKYSNSDYACHHAKFFQTHPGGYGEGDLFYGLKTPDMRKIIKFFYKKIKIDQLEELLQNPYHEIRMCTLQIMVEKFKRASEQEKEFLVKLYLNNVNYINNWDLVDLSASYILGKFWFKKDLTKLWELANSGHLWSERIAIISTFEFIRNGEYQTTIDLCKFFLTHKHDLIHKATGWMLREIGKRDLNTLLLFLDKHHKEMPRTMLRYSIEKLTQEQRKFYMSK